MGRVAVAYRMSQSNINTSSPYHVRTHHNLRPLMPLVLPVAAMERDAPFVDLRCRLGDAARTRSE
jgi:hypothetical protein